MYTSHTTVIERFNPRATGVPGKGTFQNTQFPPFDMHSGDKIYALARHFLEM